MERFEWAHASGGFRVVGPDELAELADDGNPDGDWGVAFMTGTNGCMLHGTTDQLRRLLLHAHNALPVPSRSGVGILPPNLDRAPRNRPLGT
jgi:hypothetical protein